MPEIEQWLGDAGYNYHCFISWPRTQNLDITGCAQRLQRSIQELLAASVDNPQVFLDESEIKGGDDWESAMRDALCRSIALVAVCAPIYYHPSHEWCGIEWASMARLSSLRLRNENFHAIIPVIIRGANSLPEPVKRIQHHDMSRVITSGRRYFSTKEYRNKIDLIVKRIEQVAVTLSQNRVAADCEDFQFSTQSPFVEERLLEQPMPFRKARNHE